jgi:TPR repeat protein
MLYLKGISGTPDFAQAKEWFRRAAENGNKDARAILEQLEQAASALQ